MVAKRETRSFSHYYGKHVSHLQMQLLEDVDSGSWNFLFGWCRWCSGAMNISGGGNLNVAEFVMRLNIVEYQWIYNFIVWRSNLGIRDSLEEMILKREKLILTDYVEGLQYLSEIYDDKELLQFHKDLKNDMYSRALKANYFGWEAKCFKRCWKINQKLISILMAGIVKWNLGKQNYNYTDKVAAAIDKLFVLLQNYRERNISFVWYIDKHTTIIW